MSKEKIPELQKLSTADKFAVTVELWDELSSNPDEIPVTEEQLSELDRRLKNIAMIRIESSPGKRRRQESFPVGVNGGCPSSLRRKGPSKGIQSGGRAPTRERTLFPARCRVEASAS
ncbi:MAG: addiction module protein [Verrucomicrobia bacterium]|nr:addiction module protein [Verrucomicrobiota bacterium]